MEVVYRARKFLLVRKARLVNGVAVWGEYIQHPGAVAVLALVDGSVLMVRQYRPALEAYTLEIPAGTLEPGERPEEAAVREMVEETGYRPLSLAPLGAYHPTPGVSNELIRLYYTDALEHVGPGGRDPGEADMEVVKIPPTKALDMVKDGEITDGKTMVALLLAKAKGII